MWHPSHEGRQASVSLNPGERSGEMTQPNTEGATEEQKKPVEKTLPESEVRERTSKFQQQAAAANKALKDSQKGQTQLQRQVDDLTSDLEIAKMAGGDEDSIGQARELQAARRKLEERGREVEEREQRTLEIEGRLVRETPSKDYGIQVDELAKW